MAPPAAVRQAGCMRLYLRTISYFDAFMPTHKTPRRMSRYNQTCPMSQQTLIDEFFIEHRVHVLEIAAFLDRLNRAAGQDASDDFRYAALRKAVAELASSEPGRVERVQMIFSDPDVRLLEERDQQSAWGASKRASRSNGLPPPDAS